MFRGGQRGDINALGISSTLLGLRPRIIQFPPKREEIGRMEYSEKMPI